MPSTRASVLTQKDLEKIASVLKKAIKSSTTKQMNREYFDLLAMLVDAVHQLKLTVEFDHEERLRALEDFLKEP